MKLSELIQLREYLLKGFNLKEVIETLDKSISQLRTLKNLPIDLEYNDFLDKSINHLESLKETINKPESDVPGLVARIDEQVSNLTRNYFARGYMINGHYATNGTDVRHEREGRLLQMRPETKEIVIGRIKQYSDWHYPALEIGPGDGIWTEHLVGFDPLYLVDQYQEFIDSTKRKFPQEYRNRLRGYTVGVSEDDDTDISFLPDNQFGFIFSWNLFNYFPLEHVKKYLTHCFRILRPGGTMMFSYNNGQRYSCAKFVEEGYMSYMPKNLLVSLAANLGFNITATFDEEDTISWIEITKPGELKTIKAHQVLGEIKLSQHS